MSSRKYVLCFFCLRKIPYEEAKVVEYSIPELDMKFKVYSCIQCLKKRMYFTFKNTQTW